jgi:hypothetical protein
MLSRAGSTTYTGGDASVIAAESTSPTSAAKKFPVIGSFSVTNYHT